MDLSSRLKAGTGGVFRSRVHRAPAQVSGVGHLVLGSLEDLCWYREKRDTRKRLPTRGANSGGGRKRWLVGLGQQGTTVVGGGGDLRGVVIML